MSVLDEISNSRDLQKLDGASLIQLCAELRKFILENVSQTGGHLASSLGAVELIVALNRVYDPMKDRILFDVGHQAYAHKILNGRKESFGTLRAFGGISGFPKPCESDADAFIAGHASDSISVALGMAKARSVLHQNYSVCAVIGDGSMTGGLAFEGLENAASSKEPMVIVLNDNGMAISKTVGGFSKMLQKLRVSPGYFDFKKAYRSKLGIDSAVYLTNHAIKEKIKKNLLPENTFTEIGLDYLGPIDGHDVKELESALTYAKSLSKPVLVHVITKKGKGYSFAERSPSLYHGVSPFDPKEGVIPSSAITFSEVMSNKLKDMAAKDERIFAITAAMEDGTGLSSFSEAFPSRFIDVGIAEEHAVSMAAGMAKQGLLPVFAVYSSFLQRSFDMLIHDVSLLSLHVVFCVDRAGLVGSDGETHHGVFDVAYLSNVPDMTIYAPASYGELEGMLQNAIYKCTGPVAVRYPRGGEGSYRECYLEEETVLREGTDLTIVSYGTLINSALEAAELLSQRGISAEVIKLGILNPNTFQKAKASLKKTKRLLCAEEVCKFNCIGQRILASAELDHISLKGAKCIHLEDGIVTHGAVSDLYQLMGLDAANIANQGVLLCHE